MPTLEDQIQEALAIQRSNDVIEMMREPSYQSSVRDFIRELFNNMMKSLLSDFSEEEKAKFIETVNPEAMSENLFKDEAKMREAANTSSRTQFMRSRSDVESALKMKAKIEELKKDVPEAAAELELVVEKLYGGFDSSCKFNATIIDDLAKIAKKSGMEKAVLREAVNRVIRKYLPTKEQYIAHYTAQYKRLTDSLTEFLDGVQKIGESIDAAESEKPKADKKAEDAKLQLEADKEAEDANFHLDMVRKIITFVSQGLGNKLVIDFLTRDVHRIYS
jgi:hypothetical protein